MVLILAIFSVFDKTDIADSHKKNEIVFAYTIFDGGNEKEIKNSLMISVVILFG